MEQNTASSDEPQLTDNGVDVSHDEWLLDDMRDYHDVAYEDDDVVVFIDSQGYELTELANDMSVSYDELRDAMHEQARELCNRDWAASWPVVVAK